LVAGDGHAEVKRPPTVLVRAPSQEPVADLRVPAATPYEFVTLPERRTAPWLWVLLGMVIVAVPGLLFQPSGRPPPEALAKSPPPPPPVVVREVPLEGTAEFLLHQSSHLGPSAEATALVSRALAQHRLTHPLPFAHAPGFHLTPSTWVGTEGLSPVTRVTLVIDSVHAPFFTGSLERQGVRVGLRGIVDGNDLLFAETVVLEGEAPGYTLVSQRFAGIENGWLKSTTGLEAKQGPMCVTPGAGVLPPLPRAAGLAYVHWRARVHAAIDQQLVGESTSSEGGALEPCPLTAQQREAVTEVVDGLFVFEFNDRVHVFRDGTEARLEHARSVYGEAFVDSVLVLEPEMIQAWSRETKRAR
jgi:hypothetical protein